MANDNSKQEVEGVAVGIDLGTKGSLLALAKGSPYNGTTVYTVKVATNEYSKSITPSVVWFGPYTEVGEKAWDHRSSSARNIISQVKRCMGVSGKPVERLNERFPYEIFKDYRGFAKIRVYPSEGVKEEYYAEEISAVILAHLKTQAEKDLDVVITKAVITVPSSFHSAQKKATMEAGLMAGFSEVFIINEPTAAAIAYGIERNSSADDRERNVLIYDLGGGTFDVSIVKIKGYTSDVLASVGLPNLGGDDFDEILLKHVMDGLSDNGRNLSEEDRSKLMEKCEKAKVALSSRTETEVVADLRDHTHVRVKITRAEFESMCKDKFEETRECIVRALKASKEKYGVGMENLDDVVMVGGCVRIPYISELVNSFFKTRNNQSFIRKDTNPDEAVAKGAAYVALSRFGLGPEIQFSDVNSLSLGFALTNNIFSVLIPAHTKIPVTMEETYKTAYDDQERIKVEVYEGDRVLANENMFIEKVVLTDIPIRKAGEVSVKVRFTLDVHGLTVEIVENTTNKNSAKCMTVVTRSPEQIAKMVDEATRRRRQDEIERDRLMKMTNLRRRINVLKRASERSDTPNPEDLQAIAINEEQWLARNKSASAEEIFKHTEIVNNAMPAGLQTIR